MSEPAKRYYKTFSDNMHLQSENARLKAEVERLIKAHSDALADFWGIHKGYFDLKAELDRLRASSFVTAVPSHQYDRVVKAGDAMASIIKYEPGVNTFDPIPDVVKRWNAAKEGKQP
jgi:hypothetical protein